MFRGGSARPGDDGMNRGAAATFGSARGALLASGARASSPPGAASCRVHVRKRGSRAFERRLRGASVRTAVMRDKKTARPDEGAAGCRTRQAGSPRSRCQSAPRGKPRTWRLRRDLSHRRRDAPIHLGTLLLAVELRLLECQAGIGSSDSPYPSPSTMVVTLCRNMPA